MNKITSKIHYHFPSYFTLYTVKDGIVYGIISSNLVRHTGGSEVLRGFLQSLNAGILPRLDHYSFQIIYNS
jgi:hypothetical protein